MQPGELKRIEERLRAMKAAIEALEESRRSSSQIVELDQSRTGRLSRMDALQLQSMAKAGQVRSQEELARIAAALKRLEHGTFGECRDCGDPIAPLRLEANPTVSLCVSCARARENGTDV